MASFDVVLFGPTGVTGREVARYLHTRASALGLTWAVAGRGRARIDAALAAVGATPDGILLADTADAASVEAMVAQAGVVANLVGPYARYGEPVHRACARAGVHQLDLTGEIDWVRQMIDRHGPAALDSGAAIVPSAGFESLPFDLAARLAAVVAHERHGSAVVEVDAAVAISGPSSLTAISEAVSGGTFASIVDLVRRGDGAGGLSDPHALDPDSTATRRLYDLRPRRHLGTGAWLAPLFPSPFINPPVVHRGVTLSGLDGDPTFAPSFRYREGADAASMLPAPALPVTAPALSIAVAGSQYALMGFGRLPGPARNAIAAAMARVGPKPGEGPRPEHLDEWSYRIDVRAVTANGGSADVIVEAEGHPGYKSTATLVGEAALAIAEMGAPSPGYGTPATVLGVEDLDRFALAGARFTVKDG